MLVSGALNDVTRVGKRGHDLVAFAARIPAAMIEMKVRVHHDVDVRGLDTSG